MSAMTITSINSVDQGFSANPSGGIKLNRRGRLARTLVVLSLAIVAASVAGGQAGAETSSSAHQAAQYITVTVAPGDTLWSLAGVLAEGRNTRTLVDEILEINSLSTVDVTTGQKIRIPLA